MKLNCYFPSTEISWNCGITKLSNATSNLKRKMANLEPKWGNWNRCYWPIKTAQLLKQWLWVGSKLESKFQYFQHFFFGCIGKHISVGLPKMIVKEQNSDNISIINDVTMNPVFLIVNKPIEYNSTVSISWKWNPCYNSIGSLNFIYLINTAPLFIVINVWLPSLKMHTSVRRF